DEVVRGAVLAHRDNRVIGGDDGRPGRVDRGLKRRHDAGAGASDIVILIDGRLDGRRELAGRRAGRKTDGAAERGDSESFHGRMSLRLMRGLLRERNAPPGARIRHAAFTTGVGVTVDCACILPSSAVIMWATPSEVMPVMASTPGMVAATLFAALTMRGSPTLIEVAEMPASAPAKITAASSCAAWRSLS